jgi:hypothetical protein
VRDIESTGAVGERGNAELRVRARFEHAQAQLKPRGCTLASLDAARERESSRMRLVGAGGGGLLQHGDGHLGIGIRRGRGDRVGQSLEFLVDVLLGVEAAVDREPSAGS